MNVLRLISSLALVSFFGGCAVHQAQPIKPLAPVPPSFAEDGPGEAEPVSLEPWWKTFHDPELDRLIDGAFRNNLDLEIAYARLAQAEAVAKRFRGAQRPFLTIEGRTSHEAAPGFSGDSEGTGYRLAIAAGYEIDLWNKLASRTSAALLEAKASAENIKALYLGLSARVADYYYLAVEQRAQLDLTRDTIRSFSRTLELVERRYREGLVPPLDVYQARQNLATAQSLRPLLEANLARAEHALSVLIGRYPERGITGTLLDLPEAPEEFPAGLPSALLEQRPDVRAAFLRVEAADSRIAAAIADRFPSLNLLGSYGTSRTPFSTDAISGTFWNVLLNLAQPILDGGARRAEVERTRAVFMETLRAYHRTVLLAVQEVEDALSQNRGTEQRIVAFADRARATKASLRLSLDRYRFGITEYLQVLSAQGLNFDAQSRLIAERRQLISDRITLARALGGSWMTAELEARQASIQEHEGRNR